jgi:tRNA threonylcarbamoyladenosine biosynthesis protein TsaE
MKTATFSYSLTDIDTAAQWLLQQVGQHKIICFEAPMGSGKTTLISAMCKLLHVTESTSSPTFSIINEYKTTDDKTIYHIDLYRIKDQEELLQIGFEDVLYSGNRCFIEWPSNGFDLIPNEALTINIAMITETERAIAIL